MVLECPVICLRDTDPFEYFEPSQVLKPISHGFIDDIPLSNILPNIHRLLKAPHKINEVGLQLSHNTHFLDLDISINEQDELFEGFSDDPNNAIILRTHPSVRVHNIITLLVHADDNDFGTKLASLKRIFQNEADLLHNFVTSDGLSCLVARGIASPTHQLNILGVISEIMSYVDGMNGITEHHDTIKWLYNLLPSASDVVQILALELLIAFVSYSANTAKLAWYIIKEVDQNEYRPMKGVIEIISKSGTTTNEGLLILAMTLVNQLLNAIESETLLFYDLVEALEEWGMEAITSNLLKLYAPDTELHKQCNLYEQLNRVEDADLDDAFITDPVVENKTICREMINENKEEGRDILDIEEDLAKPLKKAQNVPNNSEAMHNTTTISSGRNTIVSKSDAKRTVVKLRKVFSGDGIMSQTFTQNKSSPGSQEGRDEHIHCSVIKTETNNHRNVNRKDPDYENAEILQLEPSNRYQKSDGYLSQDQSLKNFHEKDENGEMSTPQHSRDKSLNQTLNSEGVSKIVCADDTVEYQKKIEEREIEKRVLQSLSLIVNAFDFSDLTDDDDVDITDSPPHVQHNSDRRILSGGHSAPPPPPPPLPSHALHIEATSPGIQPPPPPLPPSMEYLTISSNLKKPRSIRLYWDAVNLPTGNSKSFWQTIQAVDLDRQQIEKLFEKQDRTLKNYAVEKTILKEISVLPVQRSQTIDIMLRGLPSIDIIKQSIFDMDSTILSLEDVTKITHIVESTPKQDKQELNEARIKYPGVPFAHAENFLWSLLSITEFSARMSLWNFKMRFNDMENEICNLLFDIKMSIEEIEKNETFKMILAVLLAVGNILNGKKVTGFNLTYLEKVSDVKDTVQKRTLLHHVCNIVMEKFPQTTDLYSEFKSVHRLASFEKGKETKTHFEMKNDGDNALSLINNIDEKLNSSWQHLGLIAKHDCGSTLKSRLSVFLENAAERIVLLKVVHRRVNNRFIKFLQFLGLNEIEAKTTKPQMFCKIISEFSLKYGVIHQKELDIRNRKESMKKRKKTRGKRINSDIKKEETSIRSNRFKQRPNEIHRRLSRKQYQDVIKELEDVGKTY